MLPDNNPHSEQFEELLHQIRERTDSLKGEIRDLKKENSQLKEKIKKIQEGQTDIYSAISDTERMALKHQVLGLISKIDNHLGDE